MIKFKEFLAPSIDAQITDFFKDQAEKIQMTFLNI